MDQNTNARSQVRLFIHSDSRVWAISLIFLTVGCLVLLMKYRDKGVENGRLSEQKSQLLENLKDIRSEKRGMLFYFQFYFKSSKQLNLRYSQCMIKEQAFEISNNVFRKTLGNLQ